MSPSTSVEQELAKKRELFYKSAVARMLKANYVGEVLIARIFSFFSDDESILRFALKRDPYCLVDVPGVSLKRADSIATSIGFKLHDIKHLRNRAVLKIVLQENTRFGNVYLPYGVLQKKAKKEMPNKDISVAVDAMVETGEVIVEKGKSGRLTDLIYLKAYYEAETSVAKMLRDRLETAAFLRNSRGKEAFDVERRRGEKIEDRGATDGDGAVTADNASGTGDRVPGDTDTRGDLHPSVVGGRQKTEARKAEEGTRSQVQRKQVLTLTQKHQNFMDALADHVMDMDPEELVKEVIEDGEDPNEIAAQVKQLLHDVCKIYFAKKGGK